MLNNPAEFFVTGNDTKCFEYEGGTSLYHFGAKDCGLSNCMDFNIIFFANDIDHATDVLERLLKFKLACIAEYDAYSNPTQHHHDYFKSKNQHAIDAANRILNGKDKWEITKAPTNQVYIASWARNDNI